MCDATIRDGSLTCVRDHEGSGHVFHASWANDAVRDEETVKPKRGAS